MMEFKLKKDSGLGGMIMVAQDQKKRVIIRKSGASFLIVEFPYDSSMSEAMGKPYYSLQGEVHSEYPTKGETFAGLAEHYNDYE